MKKPDRLQIHLSPIFAAALFLHSATHTASATDYYRDNDGATAGFGIATGSWAAPSTGNATQGWSTDGTGVIEPVDDTTTTGDAVFFGNGATGAVTIENKTASTLLLRVNSITNGGVASSLGGDTGIIQIGTTGQASTDLSDWTNVLIGDPNLINANASLSCTLTGESPRFVRLSVTPN